MHGTPGLDPLVPAAPSLVVTSGNVFKSQEVEPGGGRLFLVESYSFKQELFIFLSGQESVQR